FLNNDTEPQPGWLEALLSYATANPAATVVGARLLDPAGSIQHAGVAIGQDGYPHNLYAGLPADHPAANRARPLQAVTGACMLVRRAPFIELGGFDEGYLNSLEDVDLCLRLGEAGHQIHYCPDAVLTHLESASRGRRDRFRRSVDAYRRRWRDRVRRDDLELYLEDGLLGLEYAGSYPVRLSVSPLLAAVDPEREIEIERLLWGYAHQVSDLLGEVVRLTAAGCGAGVEGPPAAGEAPPAQVAPPAAAAFDPGDFLRRARRLEAEVGALQAQLADRSPDGFAANPRLGYGNLVERVRAAIGETVPPGASVLVVSRGDSELVRLSGRRGGHFPQDPDGRYLGHHPSDSEEAVSRLEALRERGAEYLVLPSSAYWWLDHYRGFADHLRSSYRADRLEPCVIFSLTERTPLALGGAA
ncbi:MAG: glycosyltransferase, partial [Syntrophothermus sp.]